MTTTLDDVVAATAAVYVSGLRRGSAVLVDGRHLLTAAHVLKKAAPGEPDIEVLFPGRTERLPVSPVELPAGGSVDLAVLRLKKESAAPVSPVSLSAGRRLPDNVKVFGYPQAEKQATGVWRDFTVSARTTVDTVQLNWPGDGTMLGHSGGPVVGPDAALVGILLEGSETAHFDRFLPLTGIETAWAGLRRPWLFAGAAARAHARQRAAGRRGGLGGADQFQGREVSLEKVHRWLHSEDSPGQVLVITGRPGSGKSAILARSALAAESAAPMAPGASGMVFHARDATTADLLDAVSAVAGVNPPQSADDLLLELGDTHVHPSRFAVMVDALDEASTWADHKTLAEFLQQLSRLPWLRVVVATRPLAELDRYEIGGLLPTLGVFDASADNLVDLDEPPYRDDNALRRYVEALLAQDGVKRPGPRGAAWTVYQEQPDLRSRLAAVIADRASHSFLVAALTADRLSQEKHPVDPAKAGFDPDKLPTTVGEALDKYLTALPVDRKVRIQALLTALAFARGSGVSDSLWMRFARAMGHEVVQADLDQLRQTGATDYLLTTTPTDGMTRVTRLFHQALTDQLLRRTTSDDRPPIYQAILDEVSDRGGWEKEPYATVYAADHAVDAHRLAELLDDVDYLVVAEPRRLAAAVRTLPLTPKRAAVLRALEVFREGVVEDRASYLVLAGRIEEEPALQRLQLGAAGWEPRWVFWSNRVTGDLLTNLGSPVQALALRTTAGRPAVLACAQDGHVTAVDRAYTVPIWSRHLDAQLTLAATSSDGSVLVLVLADGQVVGLQTDRGAELWRFRHPDPAPYAVAVEMVEDGCMVATGTYNEGIEAFGRSERGAVVRMGVVRLWAGRVGAEPTLRWQRDLFGAGVLSLLFARLLGSVRLVASGDPYGDDLEDQRIIVVLDPESGAENAAHPATKGDGQTLAAAKDGDVFAVTSKRLLRWAPSRGEAVVGRSPVDPGPPRFLAVASHRGRPLLAMDRYGEPLLVDGRSLQTLTQPYAAYESIASLGIATGSGAEDPAVLATGNYEGDVRIWSVDSLVVPKTRTLAKIARACIAESAGVVVTITDHPPALLEVRDVLDGRLLRDEDSQPLCLHVVEGEQPQLLLGYADGRVEVRRLPDLATIWSHAVHDDGVRDLRVWGDLLVSVGRDHTVRLTTLAAGKEVRPPLRVTAWEDKGLSAVEVVETEDPQLPVLVAGDGLVFGLASWSLPGLLANRTGKGRQDHFQVIGAASHPGVVRSVRMEGTPALAVVDDRDGRIRMHHLHSSGEMVDQWTWQAHEHTVTSLSQRQDRIWTGDSWGNVRCWTASGGSPTSSPQLQVEVKLRRHVVDLLPCAEAGVVIATDAGLVRIDLHDR